MTNTSINPGAAAVGNGLVTITYTLNSPAIIQSLGDQRCGNGVVDLSATASGGSIDWYDALTGGTLLATGSAFSPTISATSTFYAEHNLGGGCVSSPRTAVVGVVDNVDTGISQTASNELAAVQNGALYQWFNCTTSQSINGETNQTYTATQDGSYAVIVFLGTCALQSTCIDLAFVGLEENVSELVSVYPNPTNGVFTVNISDVKATSIAVYNTVGEEVHQAKCNGNKAVIDLKNNAKGVYFIKVTTNDGILNQRVVKQ
jgi:hypothetical protein